MRGAGFVLLVLPILEGMKSQCALLHVSAAKASTRCFCWASAALSSASAAASMGRMNRKQIEATRMLHAICAFMVLLSFRRTLPRAGVAGGDGSLQDRKCDASGR